MKNILYLLILICFQCTLSSQDTDVGIDSILYLTPMDKAYMVDKKAKVLFKTGPLALEMKVGKAISVIPYLGADRVTRDPTIGLEARYYLGMARKIREGTHANNITGPYISAYVSKTRSPLPLNSQINGNDDSDVNNYGLRLGYQRRFMNREYFDLGLRLAYRQSNDLISYKEYHSIQLTTTTNYGFVFGKKHTLESSLQCTVINCHQNKKSSLKVNPYGLLGISRFDGFLGLEPFWIFGIRPNVIYETKLFNSSFSMVQSLAVGLTYWTVDFTRNLPPNSGFEFTNSWWTVTYDIGPRYYFLMKKQILSGKSGNNLAGPYFYSRLRHIEYPEERQGKLQIGAGWQREISGKLFMDISAGYSGLIYSEGDLDHLPVVVDFMIGYLLK